MSLFGIDFTPGFNLSHDGLQPYIAASGTKNVLGFGGDPHKMAADARAINASRSSSAGSKPASSGALTGLNDGLGDLGGLLANVGGNVGGSGGGSGGGGEDYSGQLAALSASEKRLRSLLGQADTTLDQGLSRLTNSYTSQKNRANSQYDRAVEGYNTQQSDTEAARGSALGKVDTNARTLNDSLRRILGLAAGSGSSAFQFAAPNAVAREASQNREGVLNQYGINLRDLATARGNSKEDYEDLLAELENDRADRELQLRQGTAASKQDILAQLGDIASQRSALGGGGLAAQIAAAQPFQDRYDSYQRDINSLFDRFNPSVAARALNPQQVNLGDYTVDRASINANRQMGGDAYSPYAQFLKRQREAQA